MWWCGGGASTSSPHTPQRRLPRTYTARSAWESRSTVTPMSVPTLCNTAFLLTCRDARPVGARRELSEKDWASCPPPLSLPTRPCVALATRHDAQRNTRTTPTIPLQPPAGTTRTHPCFWCPMMTPFTGKSIQKLRDPLYPKPHTTCIHATVSRLTLWRVTQPVRAPCRERAPIPGVAHLLRRRVMRARTTR